MNGYALLRHGFLEPYYEVYIVIFSAMDIAYDIRGLHVIDIHMKSVEGKAGKVLNVFRRAKRVAALKEEYGIDIAYSFGPTANLVNVFSGMRPFRKGGADRAKIWCGVRSYMDMGNPRLLRLFCRYSDRGGFLLKADSAGAGSPFFLSEGLYPVQSLRTGWYPGSGEGSGGEGTASFLQAAAG